MTLNPLQWRRKTIPVLDNHALTVPPRKLLHLLVSDAFFSRFAQSSGMEESEYL
jgi:hypothetical protein